MAGEDLLGPVELLQQHAARQKMRPGHPAKRQSRIGAVEDFGAEAVGAANRKSKFCYTRKAPGSELVGKIAARPHCAALVEGDQPRPGRQYAEDQCRLARFQRGRGQALPHLEFDDRDRRHDPRGIKHLQIGERTVAQPADGEKAEVDRRVPRLRLADCFAVGERLAPKLFEIVIGANLGAEQMHDHIARIDQHPVALRLALDRDPHPPR
jgi:hypothetical protein